MRISFNAMLFCIGALLISGVLIHAIIVRNSLDIQEKDVFMTECLADGKKQYECTAMWRGSK